MFWKLSITVGFVVFGASCSAEPLRLWEFNEQFANLSAESTVLVQGKWRENGQLNGLLNEQIVIRIGEMVHQMREVNEEAYREVQEATEIDDDCRAYLEWYYALSLGLQNTDIQLCAIYAYSDLFADTIKRFRPRAKFLKLMNTRVLHQVVRNLGNSKSSDIETNLETELRDYKYQLAEQTVLLQGDLDHHDEVLQKAIGDLEDCRDWNLLFQTNDLQYIRDNIERNCQ